MQKYTSFLYSRKIPSSTMKSLSSFFSSLPERPNADSVFVNYLIDSFNFPQSRAPALSKSHFFVKSLETPQSVVQFLKNTGFSDAQIQSIVLVSPEILLCDVDRNLKPKIEFFRNLGLAGSDLASIRDDKNNKSLIRTLRGSNWGLMGAPESRLLSNIEFVKNCGIVGSQLSYLLQNRSRLFVMPEVELKKLVSQLLGMGFSVNSRMFVHGLSTLYCLSAETFERKLELFRSFGFSRDEFIEMFRKAPVLPTVSEEKLKSGFKFFLEKVGLKKAALYNAPVCLLFSMENRVLPRYRVFKIVMSRRLLKKKCNFPPVLFLSEEKFLQKFVFGFGHDSEVLSLAYNGQNLGSSSTSSFEEES